MRKREIDRQALIARIRDLDGLTSEEKSDLIELVNTKKKYGLVWENKPERVEEEMRSKIPVFTEVKDRAIVNDTETEKYPNHILIEGDNLQALTTLAYTHEGKIDVIYIDPPYNTGNKDFIYNDSYVDIEDSYRHSKWLSFMSKRLEIAKKLLSDKGVIFISIDDNEQGQLKLLCDEIFGENEMIAQIVWKRKRGKDNSAKWMSRIHEYLMVYSYNKNNVSFSRLELDESTKKAYKNPDNDPRGDYRMLGCWARGTQGGVKYDFVSKSGRIFSERLWLFSKESLTKLDEENKLIFRGDNIYRKMFLYENIGKIPETIWDDVSNAANASDEIKTMFGSIVFDTPKPTPYISRILTLVSQRNSTILDFFAGSGTTLHATMQLNAEDGGNRQCILVTNNENNICEEVTYERNKRVIEGYATPKGEAVEGLHGNNLRYYKTELVERDNSQSNRIALMKASADLLCIKEDIYTEQDELNGTKYNKKYVRFFQDGDRSMLLVFDPRAIEHVVARLAVMDIAQPVKVYVYSADEYPYTDDFEEVADKVELVALPTALRKALQNVLPAIGPVQPIDENEVITETEGEE